LTAFELKVSPLLLALALFAWMPYARLIHGQVVLLRRAEFVVAAQAIGVGRLRMLLRYLLPNALAPVLVLAARDVGGMVVLAAAFTFIGFGDVLPWAALLVAGRSWIVGPAGNPLTFWWVYLPATLALVLFSVGWNLLGDGLNVALNPRTARTASRRAPEGL
jgi:peptide/nickel transport system permease protein